MKNIRIFIRKLQFFVVKFSIYFNRRVFIMLLGVHDMHMTTSACTTMQTEENLCCLPILIHHNLFITLLPGPKAKTVLAK